MRMYLELTGTQAQIMAAQHVVEKHLVALTDEDERGRALYYMALLNKHRSKSDKVVFQYCYHRDKPGMKHMLQQALPKNCREIIGHMNGIKGVCKKKVEKETKCKIEINPDCDKPHFVIYGDTDTDVRECGLRVTELLKQGKALAQKQGRLL
jgi:hypothetical protein